MIKYIIFDLGGVFVSDAPIFYVNKLTDFTEVLEFSGVSREDSEKIWRKHWLKLKLGQESINLFWHDFYKLINNNISLDKIKELYLLNIKKYGAINVRYCKVVSTNIVTDIKFI